MQGDKWRETTEEAVVLGISMQGDRRWFWESACRETNEGRQMKREILEISMQGDKWRETNEEGRLGAAAISVISMQGDKWRETNEEGRLGAAAISVISMQGDKWRETNEEGRLGAAAISVISMQGDKWRETNEEGRLGAAAISVISTQGDKWRETRSDSDFGNQQPNLWEVRTPIASSYLGKKKTSRPPAVCSSSCAPELLNRSCSNHQLHHSQGRAIEQDIDDRTNQAAQAASKTLPCFHECKLQAHGWTMKHGWSMCMLHVYLYIFFIGLHRIL